MASLISSVRARNTAIQRDLMVSNVLSFKRRILRTENRYSPATVALSHLGSDLTACTRMSQLAVASSVR